MRNLKSMVSSLLVLVMCLSVMAFQPMEAKAWGETFIIDPGHGGTDPGACAYGRQEAADVLFLSMRVGQIISSVNSVTYTRTTDVFVSLQGRCDIANGNGNAYFCSIHRNAGGGTGVETYYATNGSATSAAMARSVNDRLAACAPWGNNRGVKTANYTVIKNTNMPAILVEVGFIDTPADNDVFVNYFEQIAQAIANGLLAMVGQSAGPVPTPTPDPGNQLNGHSPIDLGENFVAFIRNTITGRYITEFFGNVILADASYDEYGRVCASQQWHFYRQGDGSYCLVNDQAGKLMDVAGGNYSDGTNIQVYDMNGLDPQKFYIYFIDGNFYFRCKASTKVLDANLDTNNVQIYGDSTGEGFGCWPRAFEILKINVDYGNWYLNFGTGSTVYVRNVASGKLMTANPFAYDVHFNDATYGDDQKWRLERRADGSYEFISVSSGLALDVLNGALDTGTTVNLYNDTGFRAQGFYILPTDTEDYFMIKPCYASNVLDVNGSTFDLHIYPPNLVDPIPRAAQMFEIVFENICGNWLPPTNIGNNFTAYITNEATGHTFTDMGDGSVKALGTTKADNQIFNFVYDASTKSYQIIGNSGKALDCFWGFFGDGCELVMADKSNAAHQRFRIYGDFDGVHYYISPVHTNRLVDVDAGTTTKVHLFGAGGNSNRKFKITKYTKPTPTPTPTPTPDPEPIEDSLILKGNSSYVMDGSDLYKVVAGQTAKDVLAQFDNTKAAVYDLSGNLVPSNALVGTGYTVQLIVDGVKYDSVTIIIKGDLNGDGEVSGTDYLRIKEYFLGKFKLDALALKAADIDSNVEIESADYMKMKSHFLGIINIFK